MEEELQELSNELFSAVRSWIKDRWYQPINEPVDEVIERFYHYWLDDNGRKGFDALCDELGEEVVYKELYEAVEAANIE